MEANTHRMHSHQACFVAARPELILVEQLKASSEDEIDEVSYICYAGSRRATVGVKDTVGVTSRMSLQVPLGRAAGGGVVRDGSGFLTWGQHHF